MQINQSVSLIRVTSCLAKELAHEDHYVGHSLFYKTSLNLFVIQVILALYFFNFNEVCVCVCTTTFLL